MGTKKERKLTPKQEMFCQLYTKYWNATRAAKESGYPEKTAAQMGYKLVHIRLVQQRIDELKEHALKEIGITRERVLSELGRIAFTNMKDLATWTHSGVEFLPSSEISEEIAASIVEVSETVTQAGGTLRIKQHDKVRALELLGKHQRLFADRIEQSGPDGKPIEIIGLMTREEREARIKQLLAKQSLMKEEGNGEG